MPHRPTSARGHHFRRCRLGRAAGGVFGLLHRACRKHRHLLVTNPAYPAAVATLAAAVVTQTSLTQLAAAVLTGAVAIYRTLHRSVTEF